MSAAGHLSVQAIKGRFEQLQDVAGENTINSGDLYPFRRHKTHFSTKDNSFHRDSFPLPANEDFDEEIPDTVLTSSRLRSLSVGNPPPSRHNTNDNGDKSAQKVNRNQSFKHERPNENGSVCLLNSVNFPNNNFASFSEKQRLVESIVMNIKNNAKRKEDEERKNKDVKVRDVLSITSKLEKDLKNVLERGARLKWNSKSSNKTNSGIETNTVSRQRYGLMRQTPLTKIDNNIVNVDLYPIRACISEDIDISDEKNQFESLRSESSPDLSKKCTETTALKICTDQIRFPLEVSKEPSQNKEKNNLSTSNFPRQNSSVASGETSPVRPPRRRVKKKRAPLPPPLQNQGIAHNNNDENTSTMSNRIFETFKENPEVTEDINVCTNETTLKTPCVTTNEFNYEEYCERTLEGEQFLQEKETNEHVYVNNSSISPANEDHLSSLKMNASDTSFTEKESLIPGSPPKKPPRTFAYDIYHSLKTDKKDSPSSYSTTKLTAAEIESLYTKPLKRLKDKPISSPLPPLPKSNDSLTKKPLIAPKPTDILSRAKKRFSVSEPLTSRDHKESLEKKPSIRRNSSFRFSFKRNNKSVGSALRQTTPRKETKIGKKIKIVTRNWSPRRTEVDKRVRFHSDCDADNNLDDNGEPIYATPNTNKQKVKEHPKELHYMCSPLFKDERSRESHKENRPPLNRGGFERFGLMDGLRQELRQSCRLVQKRLKSTSNDRRNYKGMTAVD